MPTKTKAPAGDGTMQTLNFQEFLKLDTKPFAIHLEDESLYMQEVNGTWWKEEGLEDDVPMDQYYDPAVDEENVRYTTVTDPAIIATLNALV